MNTLNWFSVEDVNNQYGYEVYCWVHRITGLNYVTPFIMDTIEEFNFYIELSTVYNGNNGDYGWITCYNSNGQAYNVIVTDKDKFLNENGLEHLWYLLHNVYEIRWVSIPSYFSYISGNKAVTYRLGCIGNKNHFMGVDNILSKSLIDYINTISENDVPYNLHKDTDDNLICKILSEGDKLGKAKEYNLKLSLFKRSEGLEECNWYLIESTRVFVKCKYADISSIKEHIEAACMYNYNIYNPIEYYVKETDEAGLYEVGILVSDLYRSYNYSRLDQV